MVIVIMHVPMPSCASSAYVVGCAARCEETQALRHWRRVCQACQASQSSECHLGCCHGRCKQELYMIMMSAEQCFYRLAACRGPSRGNRLTAQPGHRAARAATIMARQLLPFTTCPVRRVPRPPPPPSSCVIIIYVAESTSGGASTHCPSPCNTNRFLISRRKQTTVVSCSAQPCQAPRRHSTVALLHAADGVWPSSTSSTKVGRPAAPWPCLNQCRAANAGELGRRAQHLALMRIINHCSLLAGAGSCQCVRSAVHCP